MRFNEILKMDSVAIVVIIIIVLIIIGIISLKSKLNITILSQIKNDDINVKLNITYLFKLININIQLYPKKKNKKNTNKDKNQNLKNKAKGGNQKVFLKDIKVIYKVIKKIEIEEFYSNIEFGNKNIEFTCFIYLLINTVYGNLINIINPNKIYLKVMPNFTEDYINGILKIHIILNLKIILELIITSYKVYKKHKNKEDAKNEGYRFNKKSYGNNS